MLTTKSDFGQDNLKYVNKEIAMQWLGIAPPEGAASLTDAQQSIANIIQNFQNPKIEPRDSLITPEMDTSYLKAVERKRKGGVFLEVNEIETLYPKKSRGIISWINKELASNIDKEKP